MPFYEVDTLKSAITKYIIVGATCFLLGYIKGCEHGHAITSTHTSNAATIEMLVVNNKEYVTGDKLKEVVSYGRSY
ncbi:hypothetical protein HZB01_03810 [Candidatus Woesearchaeota archaeon]|nr:hypothetical protein [Candidatus Woesearchaeota archaeon]